MSEVSKDILFQVMDSLARTRGDGELFLRVSFKEGVAQSLSHSFSSSKYLSRLEASPAEPLSAAEEKFVTAHHNIRQKKGGTIVDPLGILNGSNKSAKEVAGRVARGSSKEKRTR